MPVIQNLPAFLHIKGFYIIFIWLNAMFVKFMYIYFILTKTKDKFGGEIIGYR